MRITPVAMLAALALAACWVWNAPQAGLAEAPLRAPSYGPSFSKHWHDGRAELSAYELIYPRYGTPRQGTAVAIFVTEPFDETRRVKPEPPSQGDYPVLKLNLVQDFATGIYDYNLMTSAFVATAPFRGRPAGAASKVSFGAQEWCGHVYAQLLFDKGAVRLQSHSYFEGEADQQERLDYPAGGFSEDLLWLWARGLAAPALAPGETLKVPVLMAIARARLQHKPPSGQPAVLARSRTRSTLTVPAGSFEVEVLTAAITRGAKEKTNWRFAVEVAPPHRIVQVERDDGYRAALLSSKRLPYWQLNGPGGEQHLKELGLTPRAPRSP